MFKVLVDYPSEEEEFRIVKMTTSDQDRTLKQTLTARDVIAMQSIVRRVPCADHIVRYATRLTRSTRVNKGEVPKFIKDYVSWGAGPRASQNLVLAGKARAVLQGRYHVSSDDIRFVARPVLRHRVLTNFNAEADGVRSDDIINWLIESTPADASTNLDAAMASRVFASDGQNAEA